MTEFSDQNIFEMHVANGERAGFWIRRTTWRKMCARIVSVGELRGPPPYYGNPAVHADVYDIEKGVLIERAAKLPSPGTYKTWRNIKSPDWAKDSEK